MFLSKFPPKFGWQKIRSTDAAPGISEVFFVEYSFCGTLGPWDSKICFGSPIENPFEMDLIDRLRL